MSRNDHAILKELGDHPLHPVAATPREPAQTRTLVIRQGSAWQSLAVLFLCLLLIAVVMLGHQALRVVERQNEETAVAMARFERKIEQVESGLAFDSARRQLLLGMRDHIMRVNPRASLADAYRYAQLALQASEKYPSVDPLLLLATGTEESRYDPQAISSANARGLYQIWPSSGRLLFRSLGWDYDDAALHDPEKNTEAAALYLDILFTAYGDPQMVLAEYNGGPLNAGYFRAGVNALAAETRNYVPQVLEVHARLKDRFEKGNAIQLETKHRDPGREGKTLAGPVSSGTAAARAAARPVEKPEAPAAAAGAARKR
jgi:soluble lytic murein transglycosylase